MPVKRGEILYITREEAVARAFRNMLAVPPAPRGAPTDAGNRAINYRREQDNGGADPEAPHCADWSYGDRTPTADCVGFVLHSSGIDRKQPGFSGTRGVWLNCASILDDARPTGENVFGTTLGLGDRVLPGDWLVTPDHIGMIVRPAPVPDPQGIGHLVIDCSPRHIPLLKRVTRQWPAIGLGGPWSKKCVVLRPKIYAESKPQ